MGQRVSVLPNDDRLGGTMTGTDSLAAEVGPLAVQPNIQDPAGVGTSAILSLRENTELSLIGVNWQRARCCSRARVRFDVSPCNDLHDPAEHSEKCSSTCWSSVQFKPFSFHDLEEVECVGSGLDLQGEADRQVAIDSEWALTTELDRSPAAGNPSLRSVGLDMTPQRGGEYVPVSILQASAMFHTIFRSLASGFVMVAPQEVLIAMFDRNLIRERGGAWSTVTRMPILTGSGLSGVAPAFDRTGTPKAAAPSLTAPFEGVFTVYAMRSMPEYRFGDIDSYANVMQQTGIELSHRTNSEAAESVRRAALRFDPFCVYALQVCLRDESYCS